MNEEILETRCNDNKMNKSKKILEMFMNNEFEEPTFHNIIDKKGFISFSYNNENLLEIFDSFSEKPDPFFTKTINYIGEYIVRQNWDYFVNLAASISTSDFCYYE
jgi:hypothetical protein